MIRSTVQRIRIDCNELAAAFWLIAILLALAVLPATSTATPLAVTNPGFEDITGETPSNEFTFGPLNGWGVYEDPINLTSGGAGPTYFMGTLTPFEPDPIGNPGVFAFFPNGAPEGQRVGIAFSFFGSGGQGEWGLVQVLADTLAPNTQYTLEVEIGNIASGTSLGGQFFALDGFPGYRVDLLAGGVIVAQDVNSLSGSIPEGAFATSVVSLTTGASHPQLNGTLSIRLVNLNVVDPAFPNSDLEVDFDDVRLDATAVSAVPILHSLGWATLLGAMAATGMLSIRLRRRVLGEFD